MLDFTSALYLGWTHEGQEAPAGEPLTLGKPAALEEPPGAESLATQVARLVGCRAGLTASGTLHLFWDLPTVLGREVEYFADGEIYPIGRWGLERAAAAGSKVTWFRHYNSESLTQQLAGAHRRPVVVTDGFCPACGSNAPLAAYLAAVRRYGGLLVVDDSQALGIFGSQEETSSPYGVGGGGSLRFHAIGGAHDIAVIGSLAKAFGSPLACLSSSPCFVRHFADRSETRVHCSPASTAAIRAGLRALQLNGSEGDVTRSRLAARVREFRRLLRNLGWQTSGGCFPVQTIDHPAAQVIHRRLLSQGVRTILQRGGDGNATRIGFVLTALHTQSQLEQAVRALPERIRIRGGREYERSIAERTRAE